MTSVPALRVRSVNSSQVNPGGDYVLYWMVAQRRAASNYALQRAVEIASQLGKPLLVFEPLRVGYRWASDRHHQFIIDGMAANRARFADSPITYFPYLEPAQGEAEGLLDSLAQSACVVVTDDYPCFFLPSLVRVAARKISVRLEIVDGNGLYPLYATDRVFTMAHSFRRHLQREVRPYLQEAPREIPWEGVKLPRLSQIPSRIARRWPAADLDALTGATSLPQFPIDHAVNVSSIRGGAVEAQRVLDRFLRERLPRYATERNQPGEEVASGLSPYLHYGHIGAHQVFQAVVQRDQWTPAKLGAVAHGKAQGWWGASPEVESFLEELLVWREIGFNFSSHRPRDYDRYSSLPDWVRATLAEHVRDRREHVYTLDEFERSRTHDPLWNAAQRQLVREGRMHNYLRMLWGKKILEWTTRPDEALAIMIELNNKYALDGRDPNSYCGIFWVLGRYDRPWGPERPIFGMIRYMSSDNTARKVDVKGYLRRYGSDARTLWDDA
ncbi:MAG: deoxyribodipyrimidine photolyase [Pirellulales bacterium]